MDLEQSLASHQPADEEEATDLARIRAFVARHPHPFDRRIREGHLTGSALVVSAAGDGVLLPPPRKLERWLQPGGHGDPGETRGEQVALREALEETGIAVLRDEGSTATLRRRRARHPGPRRRARPRAPRPAVPRGGSRGRGHRPGPGGDAGPALVRVG